MPVPVFRFAPSPNGRLHLGHAYSALLNQDMARESGGRLLLRIEDIDTERCTPAFERAIYEDLEWLGIEWEVPVRRQSEHFGDYSAALDALIEAKLAYPAFMSRGAIRELIASSPDGGRSWPHDPDGAPIYPDNDRIAGEDEARRRMNDGEPYAWRLDMAAAIRRTGKNTSWIETGAGPEGQIGQILLDPSVWGDVIIARRDVPTSYNLSVVVDDALQGVTHIVRGRDLFHATSVHRVLQEILGLNVPQYHHHQLVMGADGRKMAKSGAGTSIASLRQAGFTPADIRRQIDL
jgi:glutamyl-Q tRNA(Asp) synthetase